MMRKTIATQGLVVFGLFLVGLVTGCPEKESTSESSTDSSAGSTADASASKSTEPSGSAADPGEKKAAGDSESATAADPHRMPVTPDPHGSANKPDPHAGINPHNMPNLPNPHGEAGNSVAAESDGVLTVTGISMDVPENWEKQKPSGSMRLAQYGIPGEAGEVELVIYNFGPGMGGGTGANIERWIGQFKNPKDASAKAKSDVSRGMRGDLSVTTILVEGTYEPGAMPGMPA
jgi:hypothetical protein